MIKVGETVGIMVGPNDNWRDIKVDEALLTSQAPTAAAAAPPVAAPPATDASAASSHHQTPTGRLVGPATKRLSTLYGIDLAKVKPSGPRGNLLKR